MVAFPAQVLAPVKSRTVIIDAILRGEVVIESIGYVLIVKFSSMKGLPGEL
jgi:hypothetical protein